MEEKMASSGKDASNQFKGLSNDVYTYGSVSLVLALAQETGVIPILCDAQGPLASRDVAQQGKLKERFVSEMLNTLAAAGLVQLEAGTGGKDGRTTRFHVPQDHRKDLTKSAVCCLSISYNARNFDGVRKCFDLDGPSGLQFESEDEHSIIDQWGEVYNDSTIEAILKTPGLRQQLEDGIKVAEVGCGTGRITRRLAAMFPKTRFTATDNDSHTLERGKKMAQEEREKLKAPGGGGEDQLTTGGGGGNITFQLLDISKDIPGDLRDKFDWLLASEMLHHIPDKPAALRNLSRLLRPGGQFTVIDEIGVSSYLARNVGDPQAAALYAMSAMMPGCVDESADPEDEGSFCWGEEKAREALTGAGFRVLGMTKSEDLGASAVCMCQKPE